MSDTNYDDYDDQNENGPAALREALKKANARLKELEKTLEAEKAEKATLAGQVKKSSLAELLKAAGVPEKFASRADKDGADATPEGVKAWIDENKDFYNFGEAKPAEDEKTEPDGKANVSPELEAALRASQSLDASGVTPSDVNIVQKIQSVSADAANEEALLKELRELGVEIG